MVLNVPMMLINLKECEVGYSESLPFSFTVEAKLMTNQKKLTGRCMCGAVRVTATAKEPSVAACHCDMCRRWSSGPYFEVSCEGVEFEGEDNITKIRSSDWAERAFCKVCGSNLFYHIIDSQELQIAAGLFDDLSEFRLSLQVFIDKQPAFYSLADDTKTMTSAEVFEAYSSAPG